MSTIEITNADELEELLEHTAAPRLMCMLLGRDRRPTLQPRIVPWKGWMVEHAFTWEKEDIPQKVTIYGNQLEMLGDVGYPGLSIDCSFPWPRGPVTIYKGRLTVYQSVSRPTFV